MNEAIVTDLLTLEQAANDCYAFDETLVAQFLARPHLAGDPFVGGLTRPQRRPEPTREHLRERCNGLR
jgi:hypothetical protein